MHIADVGWIELVAYQTKVVTRIWFDQWKKNIVKGASLVSWDLSEEDLLRRFFPHELREVKV